jgi:cell division protein FtsW (lipid II flippase)
MRNLKERFLSEVIKHIHSKEAKEMVLKELNNHMQTSKLELISKGIPEAEAEVKAVKQMGSPTDLGKNLNKIHRPKIDLIIVGLYFTALLIGLLSLISIQGEFSYNYFLKQALFVFICIGIAFSIMFLDYRKLERFSWLFLGSGISLLLLLRYFASGFINGIPYIDFFHFYISSETALPFFFLFWAAYLSKEKPKLLYIIIIYLVTVMLFLSMPNLPFVMVYSVLVFTLFWSSSINRRTVYWISTAASTVLLSYGFLFWFISKDYQKIRILAFLNPKEYSDNHGYIYIKVKEMMMAGGWFGYHSNPSFIPELTTDLAFVNVTYQYGWLAAGILFLVLTFLFVRLLFISGQIKDRYGKQLIIGVGALYSIQFLYNIGMVIGILPLVSMSLPFISYGLTPTLINSFIIGIALSVYRRKAFSPIVKSE